MPCAQRVATRYLQSDLSPPLGFPGGPCHVVRRIMDEVRNPRLREELIEDVERGVTLENRDAAKVYDIEVERGVGRYKRMAIMPHAQYRMDQRGVTVNELRIALGSFLNALGSEKSLQSYLGKKWEHDLQRHEPLNWTDPRIQLAVVFMAQSDNAIRVITTYWKHQSDPKPVPGGCYVPESG